MANGAVGQHDVVADVQLVDQRRVGAHNCSGSVD